MPQALPIPGPSPLPSPTPGTTPGGRGGLLRVVSNEQLDQHEAAVQAAKAIIDPPSASPATDLNAYIRAQWTVMRDHRNMAMNGGSINDRLLRAQRMYEGEYDPGKLSEIGKFGGSQVYARIVAGKCRMATSLLRDVYLGPERPWEIQPEEDPPVPP